MWNIVKLERLTACKRVIGNEPITFVAHKVGEPTKVFTKLIDGFVTDKKKDTLSIYEVIDYAYNNALATEVDKDMRCSLRQWLINMKNKGALKQIGMVNRNPHYKVISNNWKIVNHYQKGETKTDSNDETLMCRTVKLYQEFLAASLYLREKGINGQFTTLDILDWMNNKRTTMIDMMRMRRILDRLIQKNCIEPIGKYAPGIVQEYRIIHFINILPPEKKVMKVKEDEIVKYEPPPVAKEIFDMSALEIGEQISKTILQLLDDRRTHVDLIDSLKKNYAGAKATINNLQGEITDLNNKLSEVKQYTARINELEEKNRTKANTIALQTKKLKEKGEEILNQTTTIKTLNQNITSLNKRVKELQEDLKRFQLAENTFPLKEMTKFVGKNGKTGYMKGEGES